MLKTRIILRRHASYLKWSYTSSRRFSKPVEEPADELFINLDVRLAPLPKKKPQREPFAKNFFLGKFDNEVIAYPEVQTNERQKQFEEWLAPIEDCVNRNFDSTKVDENILPFEAVEQLRELGVFRAAIGLETGGIGINATEYAKLVEVLGKNPALTTYVASRTDPIEMLLKYGSEEQKKIYLPKFINGELIPTFAVRDVDTEQNLTFSGGTAVASPCRNFWKLNANKFYVTNGNQANCFLVLANCTETDDPYHKPQTPTLFIVERQHGGVTSYNTRDKLGQRAVDSCSVKFVDTIVPKDNLIDKIGSAPTLLMDLLTLGKQNVGSQATTILKRLINAITKYTIDKKHYNQQLMSTDLAQEIIGKMTTSLYAIESMIYLTTGLVDQYEDQDISLESAIVEAYSISECITQVFNGLQLIGNEAYLKDSPFEQIYRDALALNWFNSSIADLHTFIAITGLHNMGKQTADTVHKYRNPFMFPKFILKEVFASQKGPDLAIEEHLHPNLLVSAQLLSNSVHLLATSSENLLIRHGNKVTEVHMELRRIADMAITIYAMTAVLARSSRSYCIGLRHAMDDIFIAHTICFNGQKKIQQYHDEIAAGEENNCDDIYRKLARRVIQQKGYFAEHPLKKNF